MIEKLTPEQEKRLPEFRDDWFRVGTCTDPADRPRAESAITKMYAAMGEPAPQFVWADSPLSANILICLLRENKRALLGASLGDSLRDSLGASLRASLVDLLGDSLWASLVDSLGYSLVDSLRASLVDSLVDSLGDSLKVSLWASLVDSLGNIAFEPTYLWGQQDAHWVAFYRFAGEVSGNYNPEHAERLGWWEDIARSSCWWWPYKGTCVISERPEICRLEDGVIHSEGGPYVRFRDGWSTWAIRGVLVDEQVVMRPETQTVEQIRGEQNLERKRIRIDRYGWGRYLAETRAEVLDERVNDIEASREALLKTPDGETVLMARCPSTHKVFHMEVLDPAISTCEQAQTWLHGGFNHYFSGRA